jgi:hypothetical protein
MSPSMRSWPVLAAGGATGGASWRALPASDTKTQTGPDHRSHPSGTSCKVSGA